MLKNVTFNNEFINESTSNLIFMSESPNITYDKKTKINKLLAKRLISSYNIPVDELFNYINREKEIMKLRGQNINNYAFDKNLSFEKQMIIFYKTVKMIPPVTIPQDNFDNLTMSELVIYYNIFIAMNNKYYSRVELINKRIEELKIIEKNLSLSNDKLNKKKIKIINIEIEDLLLQKQNEEKLCSYYAMLSRCMINKLRLLIGDKNISKFGIIQIAKKESETIRDNLVGVYTSLIYYNDINNNVYNEECELLKKYNVSEFYTISSQKVLNKKREFKYENY